MSAAAPTLAAILDHEAALYEELLDLLREEEAALLEGQGAAAADCIARKENLILKIRMAELSRQATVGRLTGRSDARLRDLPGADAGELGRARSRLTAILPRVAEAGRRVETLLARSLGRLHDTLAFLHEAVGLVPQYTPEARLVRAALPTLDGRA